MYRRLPMTLRELGWRDDEPIPAMAPADVMGRVAVEHRNGYQLYTEAGEFSAELAGRLRYHAEREGPPTHPVVGDWVVVRPRPGEPKGVIQSVLPRRTQFVRGAAGSEGVPQVVAANIDVVFLVSALDGELNPRRIERYITLAREGGSQPVVVLNKADLCDDVDAERRRAEPAAPGIPVLVVSALEGSGLSGLDPSFVDNQTVALLGSSGVGKSTLINRLLGRHAQLVGELRCDGKGRHTTTTRSLLTRPGGGLVLDTPGMRELQLWEGCDGHEAAFADVEDFTGACRFRDCSHVNEPGCAVIAAVQAGTLSNERWASYHKLRGEIAYLDARHDQHARGARKRDDKARNRALYRWLDERKNW
jgi:ribosome biogenesis GTPase / thiamine phosphate phosphatase